MTYYDTAYLAKCYLNEAGSARVRDHARSSGRIACCDTGRVELAAVFHRHCREGRLTVPQFKTVLSQYESDLSAGVWTWLPLAPSVLETAMRRYRLLSTDYFLRGADAIHLACAQVNGFKEIFTNDRHLLACSSAFGVKGRNVLD